MKNRLFVGNIPTDWTESDLKNFFGKAGVVISAKIIRDKYSESSRGYGLVEYGNREDAQRAIDTFNESVVNDLKLVVVWSQI